MLPGEVTRRPPVSQTLAATRSACLALLVVLFGWTAVAAASLDRKLQEASRQPQATTERVIVRVRPGRDLDVRNALRQRGIDVLRQFEADEALVVRLRSTDLEDIASGGDVVSLSIDAPVRVHSDDSDDEPRSSSWYSLASTLGVRRSQWTGAGVGVAVIDSGIRAQADFSDEDGNSRIVGFWDFTSGGVKTEPSDGFGHGTHVAGLIAGNGSGFSLYRGVAPRARLIVLKVLDQEGVGYTSDVIAALEFVRANKHTLGIDVVNLSLGHPILEPAATDPLVLAVEAVVRAGVPVVVSAGNVGINPATGEPGYGGITSPGNAPSAITVGATLTQGTNRRSDDVVAPYSSRGPSWYDAYAKPDIVAPGHHLVAPADPSGTLYARYPNLLVPNAAGDLAYMSLSGTSMAAGTVAGTVALMIQANHDAFDDGPSLTPNTIKAILQYTAFEVQDPGGSTYDPLVQGSGQLNSMGAIQFAATVDAGRPTGALWLTTVLAPWSSISLEYLPWSTRLVWGDHLVWGDVLGVNRDAWATNLVWGDHLVWGDSLVWSEPSVWANHLVWGDVLLGQNLVWGDMYAAAELTSLVLVQP